LLLGMAGFLTMADNWVVSPLLPAIAESVGAPVVSAGVLVTAYMLPFGLFQLIFGPLADRLGKTKVILWTFAAFSVATALCAAGSTLTGIALLRGLTGVFAASIMPISLALIADVVPMEKRQVAIGSFMGIAYLGQALSMGIGGTIAFLLDWRFVFIMYGLASVLVTVALWRGLRIAVAQGERRNPQAFFFRPYILLLRNPVSLKTYAVILVEGVLLLGSFSYFGAVLTERFALSPFAVGVTMTAFGIAALVAGRLSPHLVRRVGRRYTIGFGLLLGAVANLLVSASASSLVFTAVGVFLLGFAFMTAHSTLLTIATGFAGQARGAAMSLAPFCFMLGGALGTQVAGRIAGAMSFDALYGVFGVGLLLLGFGATAGLKATGFAVADTTRSREHGSPNPDAEDAAAGAVQLREA